MTLFEKQILQKDVHSPNTKRKAYNLQFIFR